MVQKQYADEQGMLPPDWLISGNDALIRFIPEQLFETEWNFNNLCLLRIIYMMDYMIRKQYANHSDCNAAAVGLAVTMRCSHGACRFELSSPAV